MNMSTREMAYNIFNQLSEEQLAGFIAMFGKFYPQTENGAKEFEELESMIKTVPDFDYEKEMEEWKKEKFDI